MTVVRQPRSARVLVVVLVGGFGAFLVAGSLLESDGYAVAGVVLGVALCLFAVLATRLAVRLGQEEVVVVGWLGSVALPWSQVERFELRDGGGLRVRRRDGETHRIAAFGTPYRDLLGVQERRNARALERLEQARRDRQV